MARVLAVVGYSPERWDDLEAFWAYGVPHDVCCINRTGLDFPCDFDLWCSYHSTELLEWAARRSDVTARLITTGRPNDGVMRFKMPDTGGSSTLQAVRVALRYLGYSKVVVCGASLYGNYGVEFLPAWKRHRDELSPLVRSMSGNTREVMGAPTQEWLYDNR